MGDSWFWFMIALAVVLWIVYLVVDWKRKGSP